MADSVVTLQAVSLMRGLFGSQILQCAAAFLWQGHRFYTDLAGPLLAALHLKGGSFCDGASSFVLSQIAL